MKTAGTALLVGVLALIGPAWAAQEWRKPYSPPCTERENVFAFTQKPAVKLVGKDKYAVTFAVKGHCDVTVGIIDKKGKVVRHLGSGVLGKNAPPPFQKGSLKQTVYWDGKDDLDVYVRQPEKLKVRVMLGLKPEFDKLLGPTHPKALPGYVWGMDADESGVYVFARAKGGPMAAVRKYDHDGNYVATIHPPPAGMPPEKYGGRSFIEYEPGKKSPFGPDLVDSTKWSRLLPPGVTRMISCRPSIAGDEIYFLALGTKKHGPGGVTLHSIRKDGSTTLAGMKGRFLYAGDSTRRLFAFTAASPDGKYIYLSGVDNGTRGGTKGMVLRARIGDNKRAEVFAGKRDPGSDNAHLNCSEGVACDAEGRVYVADKFNNRVQVFSPEGKYLKTIKIGQPKLVQVHRKTGAVYVAHSGRSKGRSSGRLTKLKPFPDLSEERHWDGLNFSVMTLDSWSPKPRLWLSLNPIGFEWAFTWSKKVAYTVRVIEEDNGKLKTIIDFDEEARRAATSGFRGRWTGGISDEVDCDPVRERVVYMKRHLFDLVSGRYLGRMADMRTSAPDDLFFDKYGYMHVYVPAKLDPPLRQGIGRLNPDRTETLERNRRKITRYVEVPYDHGVASAGWIGVLPLYATDRHGWSWGMGGNMRGDIAVVRYVSMAPSMPGASAAAMTAGRRGRLMEAGDQHRLKSLDRDTYTLFTRHLKERQKTGESFFLIKRRPGVDVMGGTIFTFDKTGEKRDTPAAHLGGKSLDAGLDEDGKLYFMSQSMKLIGGKPFLHNKAGVYGSDGRYTPTTGVRVKAQPKGAMFVYEKAAVPLEPRPSRPPDLVTVEGSPTVGGKAWVTGAEWIYAGASPYPIGPCTCPQLRPHLDWYKRSFVPEAYRRSIGVVDTNGNLVMHIGQYGNWDSGFGRKSRVPVGGDGIAMTFPRYISGTDNYLVFGDRGERLVVLKLNYHAEETVAISVPVKGGRE